MNCPTDGTTLLMSERQGIEIDYCPQCRGIWLDRGELDKILERAKVESEGTPPQHAQAPTSPPQARPAQSGYDQPRHYEQPRYDNRQGDARYDSRDPRYRKKKSPFEFLGDFFE